MIGHLAREMYRRRCRLDEVDEDRAEHAWDHSGQLRAFWLAEALFASNIIEERGPRTCLCCDGSCRSW